MESHTLPKFYCNYEYNCKFYIASHPPPPPKQTNKWASTGKKQNKGQSIQSQYQYSYKVIFLLLWFSFFLSFSYSSFWFSFSIIRKLFSTWFQEDKNYDQKLVYLLLVQSQHYWTQVLTKNLAQNKVLHIFSDLSISWSGTWVGFLQSRWLGSLRLWTDLHHRMGSKLQK